MKFVIWKIDDSRSSYVEEIESSVECQRAFVDCVDGSKINIEEELSRFGMPSDIYSVNTPGEYGVWLTFLNTMEYVSRQSECVVTFEDDAILLDDFMNSFLTRVQTLPKDFDFFSLFIPRDHVEWINFTPEEDERGIIVNGMKKYIGRECRRISEDIYKPWQRYGGVSMLWSPAGARKVLDMVKSEVFGQWDEYVYALSRRGALNGYTSNPDLPDLVRISGEEKSLVH